MEDRPSDADRRRLLALLGSGLAAGLAGCGSGDEATPTDTATPTESDAVPAAYETATSLGGSQRDPESLVSKSAVSYQQNPNDGQQCSNCQLYIPDKNGDGLGACAVVEGTIAPDAWCTSYVAHESTATETETESPSASLDEPVAVPTDASCPVCQMVPADYPDWNAQVGHEDGERAFFDTSGCLLAYYAVPDRFASTDAPVSGVWVTDFETRETVDGLTAHYALESDPERVDDPMMLNPAPFADRADAVAYVDAVDYLTTDDVVGIEAFDRELAERYRGRFLDEG